MSDEVICAKGKGTLDCRAQPPGQDIEAGLIDSRVEAGGKEEPVTICTQVSRAVRGGRRPNCPQKAGRSLAQLD